MLLSAAHKKSTEALPDVSDFYRKALVKRVHILLKRYRVLIPVDELSARLEWAWNRTKFVPAVSATSVKLLLCGRLKSERLEELLQTLRLEGVLLEEPNVGTSQQTDRDSIVPFPSGGAMADYTNAPKRPGIRWFRWFRWAALAAAAFFVGWLVASWIASRVNIAGILVQTKPLAVIVALCILTLVASVRTVFYTLRYWIPKLFGLERTESYFRASEKRGIASFLATVALAAPLFLLANSRTNELNEIRLAAKAATSGVPLAKAQAARVAEIAQEQERSRLLAEEHELNIKRHGLAQRNADLKTQVSAARAKLEEELKQHNILVTEYQNTLTVRPTTNPNIGQPNREPPVPPKPETLPAKVSTETAKKNEVVITQQKATKINTPKTERRKTQGSEPRRVTISRPWTYPSKPGGGS